MPPAASIPESVDSWWGYVTAKVNSCTFRRISPINHHYTNMCGNAYAKLWSLSWKVAVDMAARSPLKDTPTHCHHTIAKAKWLEWGSTYNYMVRLESFRWTVSFELLPSSLVDPPLIFSPLPVWVCVTRALLPIASSLVLAIMGEHVTTDHYCQFARSGSPRSG